MVSAARAELRRLDRTAGCASRGDEDDKRGNGRRDAGGLAHVCFVAPYAWPVISGDDSIPVVGGAEVQQTILARLFVRAGYRVSMICVDYGQGDRRSVSGVTVFRTYRPDAGVPVLRFIHPRLTSTWRALREVDADIYYQRSSSMLTGVVAQFCRRHGRHSIYAGASDADFMPGRQPIRYRRDRWLYERGLGAVDRIVVQNPNQQRDCLAHYGRQGILIPSCYVLPDDAQPGRGSDVLWVGTMRDYKRPEMLFDMARRLPHRRFVMVGGPGPDAPAGYFERMRNEAGTIPNLEFKGFLPLHRAEPCFDHAAVFVNTSTYEGVPNTFMQAWARGVPTVATVDVGARPDGGQGGPLYPVIEDAQQGAAEIERLLSDPVCHAAASRRCRDWFDHTHSASAVMDRYTRLFDGLMQPEAP